MVPRWSSARRATPRMVSPNSKPRPLQPNLIHCRSVTSSWERADQPISSSGSASSKVRKRCISNTGTRSQAGSSNGGRWSTVKITRSTICRVSSFSMHLCRPVPLMTVRFVTAHWVVSRPIWSRSTNTARALATWRIMSMAAARRPGSERVSGWAQRGSRTQRVCLTRLPMAQISGFSVPTIPISKARSLIRRALVLACRVRRMVV